ncbi:MAG: hypothetical protein ACRD63_06230 [Pyrinomonadaceae bacterium]
MSPKSTSRRRVGRHRARDYWQVATHLMESARALLALGDEEYSNAIGICLIHATISANDSITITTAEVRSSNERHADAQRLLQEVVPEVPAIVLRAFGAVIQAKFEYEYSGEVITLSTAKRLFVKAERFYKWAADLVGR